jgi:hypothetical protein
MQTINAFQTVLSDDFSGGSTLAGNLGSPQIGTAWALYDSAWAASVKGRKLNGSFVTATQGSTGNVTAVQKLNATPGKVEFSGQWDADSGSGAAGYFSVAIGSAIGTSQSAAVVNIKRDGMYFYKLDAGSATLLASESYSALTNGTSYTFTIKWIASENKVEVYKNAVLTAQYTSADFADLVGPYVCFSLQYTASDSTHAVKYNSVSASADYGLARMSLGTINPILGNPSRYKLWDISPAALVGGDAGWMHHMIVSGGKVLASSTVGNLYQVDLASGSVLNTYEGIAFQTAPVVAADGGIWCLKPDSTDAGNYDATLTRLNASFAGTHSVSIPGGRAGASGVIQEYLPYSSSAKVVLVRVHASNNDYLEAWITEDASPSNVGTKKWRSAALVANTGTFNNVGAPLIVGSYAYVLSSDGGSKHNYLKRIALSDGSVTHTSTDIGSGGNTQYNNPIYTGTDIILTTQDGYLAILDPADCTINWSVNLRGAGYNSWASPTYVDGYIYVGLYNGSGTGQIAKVDVTDGSVVWRAWGYNGEDCWHAGATDGRYLYRNMHSKGSGQKGGIVVQDIASGGYVYFLETDTAPCTMPCLSNGIAVFGNGGHLVGVRVGTGTAVDYPWHGTNATGFVTGAVTAWS